jgi:hypothetical protein
MAICPDSYAEICSGPRYLDSLVTRLARVCSQFRSPGYWVHPLLFGTRKLDHWLQSMVSNRFVAFCGITICYRFPLNLLKCLLIWSFRHVKWIATAPRFVHKEGVFSLVGLEMEILLKVAANAGWTAYRAGVNPWTTSRLGSW